MESNVLTERLNRALHSAGMTQADLARETGIDRASISLYLSGKYLPKTDKLLRLASALHVSSEWLSGIDNVQLVPTVALPLCTGINGNFEPYFSGESINTSRDVLDGDPGQYFFFQMSGLSMYPRLIDGDLVLFRTRKTPLEGRILLLAHDTELQVRTYQNGLLLPANPEYAPRTPDETDLVFGYAVSLIRKL